jgi:peroxiredoxin
VKIAGQTVPAVLDDAGAVGHFRISQDAMMNPMLWLGVTNPATKRVGLTVPLPRPFEVDGKWWTVTNLTPEGAFQVAAAAKPVATEAKPEVDLSPGKKAPAFTAKLTNGKTVKFPDDYKGKVVLLDFWATWCGPCVAEIPNVVKAYEKYHGQGMEVLGISLDKEDWTEKLGDFTKKRNMPWPQVYDGKYWQAEVAKLYGIRSIPHMLLVDGDTGLVIANKTIRGEALAPAIENALAAKKK